MGKYRQDRVNEEMKKQISIIIRNEVKDVRLSPLTSVTSVEATKDLKYAKVFISIFGTEEEKAKSMEALVSSAGFIRGQLGKHIKLRSIPQLIMTLDNSVDRAMRIEELLKVNKVEENDNE